PVSALFPYTTLFRSLVRLVLADELSRDEARVAAEGWGGDVAVAWRDGDRACVTATLVGDDVRETEEMRQAFERWAAAKPDARVRSEEHTSELQSREN